ncbi:MAG: hypothetical protein HYR60_27340 [Acidobacteria bacterium]|nr:hypothetical protein [Acidobacteriota bacterium]
MSAVPIMFDVNCAGMKVGSVSIDTSGTGISGGFTSTIGGPPPTQAAAAAKCGEDHFNWYQIVTATTAVGLVDNAGRPFGAPFVDPPAGGFGGQWADNLPWYFDEYRPPAGTAGFNPNFLTSTNTVGDTLSYFDFPGGPPGTRHTFKTWLVSLNADSSFHSFHGGFSWEWTNVAGTRSAGNIQLLGAGIVPTRAEYNDLIGNFATKIPEPSMLSLLLACGTLVYLMRRRL